MVMLFSSLSAEKCEFSYFLGDKIARFSRAVFLRKNKSSEPKTRCLCFILVYCAKFGSPLASSFFGPVDAGMRLRFQARCRLYSRWVNLPIL